MSNHSARISTYGYFLSHSTTIKIWFIIFNLCRLWRLRGHPSNVKWKRVGITSVANVRNDTGVSPVFLQNKCACPDTWEKTSRPLNKFFPVKIYKQPMLQRVIIFVWWWQLKSHKNHQKGKYTQKCCTYFMHLHGLCLVQNILSSDNYEKRLFGNSPGTPQRDYKLVVRIEYKKRVIRIHSMTEWLGLSKIFATACNPCWICYSCFISYLFFTFLTAVSFKFSFCQNFENNLSGPFCDRVQTWEVIFLTIFSYLSEALNAEFHVIHIQKITASTIQIISWLSFSCRQKTTKGQFRLQIIVLRRRTKPSLETNTFPVTGSPDVVCVSEWIY